MTPTPGPANRCRYTPGPAPCGSVRVRLVLINAGIGWRQDDDRHKLAAAGFDHHPDQVGSSRSVAGVDRDVKVGSTAPSARITNGQDRAQAVSGAACELAACARAGLRLIMRGTQRRHLADQLQCSAVLLRHEGMQVWTSSPCKNKSYWV